MATNETMETLMKRLDALEALVTKEFTPDWRAKGPDKERDIDKYAEARKRKGENRTWGIKETGEIQELYKILNLLLG